MKKLGATRFITYTALMVALALLSQSIRFVFPGVSTLIVGSLVNMCLAYAAISIGLSSALVVAVITPLVAFLQGQLPLVQFIPVVALGNAVLVVLLYVLRTRPVWLSAIAAAVAKFAALFVLISLWLAPLLLPGPKAEAIAAAFSYPQLITALVGIALARLIAMRFTPDRNRP